MVFERYSSYYDSFYPDKDYQAEVLFLEHVFHCYSNRPIQKVLELGCGTGGHAVPLTQRGYRITGVDRSADMLRLANLKAQTADLSIAFTQNDIRDLNLNSTFDAVISLFGVMSYQTGNTDLSNALQSARRHLEKGGLFVFDVWSGFAVLSDRPVDRLKLISKDDMRLIRYASPKMDLMNHTVEIRYKILCINGTCVVDEIDESHLVRFFFPQEISYFLAQNGFQVLHFCPFMEPDRTLGESDWNLAVIAEAV